MMNEIEWPNLFIDKYNFNCAAVIVIAIAIAFVRDDNDNMYFFINKTAI